MVVLEGRLVLGARARGTAGRGRRGPLRGAQRRVEQAERVPGQPGQGVTHAGELAASGAARVPVPARRPADRAPLTLRGLVGRLLGGRGLQTSALSAPRPPPPPPPIVDFTRPATSRPMLLAPAFISHRWKSP